MIKLNQVVCELNAVDSINYVEDDFHLEIDEVIYHECVTELSRIPTKESSKEMMIGEGNSATTSRGRSLRFPHRYCQQNLQVRSDIHSCFFFF